MCENSHSCVTDRYQERLALPEPHLHAQQSHQGIRSGNSAVCAALISFSCSGLGPWGRRLQGMGHPGADCMRPLQEAVGYAWGACSRSGMTGWGMPAA